MPIRHVTACALVVAGTLVAAPAIAADGNGSGLAQTGAAIVTYDATLQPSGGHMVTSADSKALLAACTPGKVSVAYDGKTYAATDVAATADACRFDIAYAAGAAPRNAGLLSVRVSGVAGSVVAKAVASQQVATPSSQPTDGPPVHWIVLAPVLVPRSNPTVAGPPFSCANYAFVRDGAPVAAAVFREDPTAPAGMQKACVADFTYPDVSPTAAKLGVTYLGTPSHWALKVGPRELAPDPMHYRLKSLP